MEGHYVSLEPDVEDSKTINPCTSYSVKDTGSVNTKPVYHNLWCKENIAIPLTYICVGFMISFPSAYIQYYPRTLGATDSQLSTIGTVRALPWTFKVFYGIFADFLPINGYRFKPYMLIGYSISCAFNSAMAISSEPGIIAFTMMLLGCMFGLIMADVMGDALVATRAKEEPPDHRGYIQSTVYMCRFLSEVVGYWLGAFLCNRDAWGWGLTLSQAFTILATIPIFVAFPSIYLLDEAKVDHVLPIKQQIQGLWDMVQLRAVWQPLSFIVIYNSLNTFNAAWGNYLQVEFHFTAFQYGSMSAVGSTVAFFGVYYYRKYFLRKPNTWRWVYLFTTLVIVMFSMLNVLLVFRINEVLGIPAYWFSMGDNAIQYFAYGVQYLPSAVMFVSVCPNEQEGIAFAMLTGFQNLAGGMASTLSNLLLGIWPVQLQDMKNGNLDGVWKLTLLTNSINLVPLFFLPWLLPKGIEELNTLKHYHSRVGGILLLITWAIGFVWVITLSLLAVIEPCHRVVGGNGC